MTFQAETTDGMLRVRIRPRINWLILLSTLLLLLIIVGAGLIPAWERLNAALHNGGIGGPILGLLVLVALTLVVIYGLLTMLFASEVIILNETTLEIERWLLTILLSDRSFPNCTIENLRYDEWSGGKAGMQNAIRFESAGETITFAGQTGSEDSYDLIDRMCKIYKFPKKEDSAEVARSPAVTDW